MKRFTFETLGYIAFTFGLILVISSQFKGCQTDPIPESQARLPVEQNFHQEKIWTEDDFKQADVDPIGKIQQCNPNVLFADCRSDEVAFKDRNKLRKLEIKPDVIHDFTNMPYPDKSFKLVIFDPPHLIQGGTNSWLVKKYGRLNKDWQTQIK